MRIKYIHASTPEDVKIHDTEKVRKNTFFNQKTQEEVDDHEIICFERDKARGVVLHYEIIKEDGKQ